MLNSLFFISSIITAGFTPVFSIIRRKGDVKAFSTIRAPINSSSIKFSLAHSPKSLEI
jgi:hypothetical protein